MLSSVPSFMERMMHLFVWEMLEGQMELQKLNNQIVDVFVAKIAVYDKERVEINWKFRMRKKAEIVVNVMEIHGRG